MTFRAPPFSGSTVDDLKRWADQLGRETERYINRLAIDVQLGRVRSYVKTDLPDAEGIARVILVSDESGGAVLAYNDGARWRRVTDRAVVS